MFTKIATTGFVEKKGIVTLGLVSLLIFLFAPSFYAYEGIPQNAEMDGRGESVSANGRNIPIQTPKGKTVTEKELETIKGVIKNDFLINDDTTGGCYQYSPSVAMDSSGNFVVVWYDYRNGNSDIYGQRYDASGNAQGANFRVNDDTETSSQYSPSVAMDGVGDFVVVWQDYHNGEYDIYGQIYDASGSAQGVNFKVNDDTGTSFQGSPSVAMDSSGDFVVVWQDYRNGDYDIYEQRYDASGSAQGVNFKVNDDTGTSFQGSPSVAMDSSGDFVVVWDDYRNGDYDIYAQRYDASGSAQGVNFRVNDDSGTSLQRSPSVGMDGSEDFVVVWEDERNDDSNIYGQRYDASGSAQGANFKVNDDTGTSWRWSPSIGMDGSGDFVVVWYDYRNGDSNIYGQRYDTSGSTQGTNFKVNGNSGTKPQGSPSVAMDGSGDFVVVWEDGYNVDSDIYGQRYDASGNEQGLNFKINDDEGSSSQYYPSVAMDSSGNFVVVWRDGRNGDYDIYGQRYDASGSAQGVNFRVNDDAGISSQYHPSVAMDSSGDFVIVWEDGRNGNSDIYAQRYDVLGSAQGANFKVSDDTGSSYQSSPSIAMDDSGGFVVVWEDERNGDSDIYAQRYDASGNVQGVNFKVNDDGGTSSQYSPSVAMDGSGDFVIVWQDWRNGDLDIYAQRYDASGSAQGANFKVNDDTGTSWQWSPSVAMDSSGDFVVVWQDGRNGDYDIYGQRYDASGSAQGSNFRVNDDAGTSSQYSPSVAMDPSIDRFVIVWTDSRDADGDPEVLAQKYENGNPVGSNAQINEPDLFPYNHQSSWTRSVACNSNSIAFTWMDNRRHKGWDVYGKLTDWDLTGIEESSNSRLSNSLTPQLLGTYPNPFTRYAVIKCQISVRSKVSLRIYDITGRLVKTLVDGEKEAGYYTVRWDARGIKSGIYFVRFKTNNYEETRKMVLMK